MPKKSTIELDLLKHVGSITHRFICQKCHMIYDIDDTYNILEELERYGWHVDTNKRSHTYGELICGEHYHLNKDCSGCSKCKEAKAREDERYKVLERSASTWKYINK